MAQWKKIITSGSAAELSSLKLSTPLSVSDGGTGNSTLTAGSVLLGNGTSAVTTVSRGNISGDGKVIISGGTSAILGNGVSLSIGGNIASGSKLNDISSITPTDSVILVGNGTTWVAESGATARTSLGLGSSDNVTFATLTATNLSNSGAVSATHLTGSFTGSFIGDGSQLTGLPSAPISTYNSPGDNRIITSVNSTTVQGEANLTFDGTTLIVSGNIDTNGSVNAASYNMTSTTAGSSNDVVVRNSTNKKLEIRSIDSRVWGSSLVDGTGATDRIALWTDSNSVGSDAELTYNSSTNVLKVGNSSFGNDVYVAGDLTIVGTASFQHTNSLLVADKFVVFNSGSATGDGGFIVQSHPSGGGVSLFYDDSANRFALQQDSTLSPDASTGVPDAYIAAVVDVDNASFNKNSSSHSKPGNIMISGSDAWIYI